MGAKEAAHHRLGLVPAAGGDFRLPGLLACGPLGIFGHAGLGWLHPLLQDGAEPEAGSEAEAAAAHDNGQAVGQGYLADGTGREEVVITAVVEKNPLPTHRRAARHRP